MTIKGMNIMEKINIEYWWTDTNDNSIINDELKEATIDRLIDLLKNGYIESQLFYTDTNDNEFSGYITINKSSDNE